MFENSSRFRALQVAVERADGRGLMTFHNRHRVFHRFVAVFREDGHHADFITGYRV
ncbi:hypothetical protein D3C78_1996420 [compost metagenome]